MPSTPPPNLCLINQETPLSLPPDAPEEEDCFLSEQPLPPHGSRPRLPSSFPAEAMDSTPGSAKRARPTDSPAKGQPKPKIAAQEITPDKQEDSSPDVEAVKRADRPPGPPKWEEEKEAMQAMIYALQHQAHAQASLIAEQAKSFNAALMQADAKFVAALERTKEQVHASLQSTTKDFSNGLREVEVRVVKQVANTTAKVVACETRISDNEKKFAAMNASFQELIRDTERKLRELTVTNNTSMEVDGQARASIGRPPDRDISFQISGISSIKKYIKAPPHADAADIAVELMELMDEYHAVTRVIIVDIKGKTRQTADSVIVYMSSSFHKQKATNDLRQYLKVANEKGFCWGVSVKDCFDLAEQPRARALNRYAGHLREEKQIDGFRIVNKQGSAVLQTYIGYQNWAVHTVQPEILEPYYLTKEQREKQQAEGSSPASLPTAPSISTRQTQQAIQTRPRGRGQGRGSGKGATRGRGPASGAAGAQPMQQPQHSSSAPATHPNNIPISRGEWKSTRQTRKEHRWHYYERKEQPSSEQQISEQPQLQSAPLSAEQREQERRQRDKEDAEALRRIEDAFAEQKDTILRRKAAREAAENRKVSEHDDI
jgi:hypothetical protein